MNERGDHNGWTPREWVLAEKLQWSAILAFAGLIARLRR